MKLDYLLITNHPEYHNVNVDTENKCYRHKVKTG